MAHLSCEKLFFKDGLYRDSGPVERIAGLVPDRQPADLTELEKVEFHRQRVVRELIETEASFVLDMEILSHLWVAPAADVLPEAEWRAIFGGIDDMLVTHQIFIKSILSAYVGIERPETNRVGSLLVSRILPSLLAFADSFYAHGPLALGYEAAVTQANRSLAQNADFAALSKAAEAEEACRGLVLHSFLVKPISRVCKYPLLLRELVRHTPKDHSDFAALSKAFETVTAFVEEVNGQRKRQEESARAQN